ncbi:unnamed protein product [Enterobius vermicularis]|uniref:Seipin n=1 Tax=Enterobius vermicularis TaxID=51028 RepID=A0A0N4UT03_ENTVE|nr:unnamed protein product [Enterobius vermicularis]
MAALRIQFWDKIRSQLSAFKILVILLQIGVALGISLFSPLFLRYFCLPKVVEYSPQLHFTFTTCPNQLAGVCSFPTAIVSLTEDGVALPDGIRYDIFVEVPAYVSKNKNEIGAFQVVVEIFTSEGRKVSLFRRTTFLDNSFTGFLPLAKRFLFFPLNLFKWWDEEVVRDLRIHVTDRFVEDPVLKTSKMSVQIQNRFLQVASGKLFLNARFGFFRSFLYNWPFLSSIVIIGVFLSCTFSLLTVYWGYRSICLFLKDTDLTNLSQSDVYGKEVLRGGKMNKLQQSSSCRASYESFDSVCQDVDSVVPNEKNNISFENVANPFNGDSGNFEGTALRRRRVKKSYEHTVRSPR